MRDQKDQKDSQKIGDILPTCDISDKAPEITHPVIAQCGHTFEEASIKEYQKKSHRCPYGCHHEVDQLTANLTLKSLIVFLDPHREQTLLAGTHLTQLQPLIRCPITQKVFEDPHLISCGHSVEKEVIEKGKSLYCPHCQQESKVVEAEICNYSLKTLLESLTPFLFVDRVSFELHHALRQNDQNQALTLLKEHPDLMRQALNHRHETVLHWIVQYNHVDLVTFCAEQKAEFGIANDRGRTPIEEGARLKRWPLVVKFPSRLQVDVTNQAHYEKALLLAAEDNQLLAVDDLIKKETTQVAYDSKRFSAFHHAVRHNNAAMMKVLQKYFSINLQFSPDHPTPLITALSHPEVTLDTLQKLLEYKEIDVNQTCQSETPLMVAVKKSTLDKFIVFIHRENINLHAKKGKKTALQIAEKEAKPDKIKILYIKWALLRSEKKEAKESKESASYLPAALSNFFSPPKMTASLMAEWLHEFFTIVNPIDWNKALFALDKNPFFQEACALLIPLIAEVALKTQPEFLKNLLTIAPQAINAPMNHQGDRLLHLAVRLKNEAFIRYLFDSKSPLSPSTLGERAGVRGSNLTARNDDNLTPMELVVQLGHWECLPAFPKIHLEEIPEQKNETGYGKALLQAAEKNRTDSVIHLLERNAPITECHGEFGFYALHYAVSHNNHSLLRALLLKADANLQKSPEHPTPLMVAVKNSNDEASHKILSILLEQKTIQVELTERGETPLQVAVQRGYWNKVNLLLRKPQSLERLCDDGKTIRQCILSSGQEDTLLELRWATLLYSPEKLFEVCTQKEVKDPDPESLKNLGIGVVIEAFGMFPPNTWLKRLAELKAHPHYETFAQTLWAQYAFIALEQNQIEFIHELLKSPQPSIDEMRDGQTLLHQAVLKSQNNLVQSLIENKADVNQLTLSGNHTPLALAVLNDPVRVDTLQVLLEQKAVDVNLLSNDETALMLAIKANQLPKVAALVQHPASDLEAKSKSDEKTTLFLAQKARNPNIHKLLNTCIQLQRLASGQGIEYFDYEETEAPTLHRFIHQLNQRFPVESMRPVSLFLNWQALYKKEEPFDIADEWFSSTRIEMTLKYANEFFSQFHPLSSRQKYPWLEKIRETIFEKFTLALGNFPAEKQLELLAIAEKLPLFNQKKWFAFGQKSYVNRIREQIQKLKQQPQQPEKTMRPFIPTTDLKKKDDQKKPAPAPIQLERKGGSTDPRTQTGASSPQESKRSVLEDSDSPSSPASPSSPESSSSLTPFALNFSFQILFSKNEQEVTKELHDWKKTSVADEKDFAITFYPKPNGSWQALVKKTKRLEDEGSLKKAKVADEQLGWNCFDVAMNLAQRLETKETDPKKRAVAARQQLVKRLLNHTQDEKYRSLLAPEIRTVAGMTVAYLQQKQDDKQATLRLVELFQVREAVSHSYEIKQVDEAIQECLDCQNPELNALEALSFPQAMLDEKRCAELKKLVGDYDQAHIAMQPLITKCNQELQKIPLSYSEMERFFYTERYVREIDTQSLPAFSIFKELQPKVKQFLGFIGKESFDPEDGNAFFSRIQNQMYHPEMRQVFQAICRGVMDCNRSLGRSRLSLPQLVKFFNEEKTGHQELRQEFQKQYAEKFAPHEKAFQEFCQRPDIYRDYLQTYYGQNKWVAFQRSFSGESNSTSFVDLTAMELKQPIVIYQKTPSGRTVIYSTTKDPIDGAIEIEFQGNNHFVRLPTVSKMTHSFQEMTIPQGCPFSAVLASSPVQSLTKDQIEQGLKETECFRDFYANEFSENLKKQFKLRPQKGSHSFSQEQREQDLILEEAVKNIEEIKKLGQCFDAADSLAAKMSTAVVVYKGKEKLQSSRYVKGDNLRVDEFFKQLVSMVKHQQIHWLEMMLGPQKNKMRRKINWIEKMLGTQTSVQDCTTLVADELSIQRLETIQRQDACEWNEELSRLLKQLLDVYKVIQVDGFLIYLYGEKEIRPKLQQLAYKEKLLAKKTEEYSRLEAQSQPAKKPVGAAKKPAVDEKIKSLAKDFVLNWVRRPQQVIQLEPELRKLEAEVKELRDAVDDFYRVRKIFMDAVELTATPGNQYHEQVYAITKELSIYRSLLPSFNENSHVQVLFREHVEILSRRIEAEFKLFLVKRKTECEKNLKKLEEKLAVDMKKTLLPGQVGGRYEAMSKQLGFLLENSFKVFWKSPAFEKFNRMGNFTQFVQALKLEKCGKNLNAEYKAALQKEKGLEEDLRNLSQDSKQDFYERVGDLFKVCCLEPLNMGFFREHIKGEGKEFLLGLIEIIESGQKNFCAQERDEDGNSLMHYAVLEYALAKQEYKANKTSVHKNKLHQCREIIRVLYAHECSPYTYNKNGQDAFDYANAFMEQKLAPEGVMNVMKKPKEDTNQKIFPVPDWDLLFIDLEHLHIHSETALQMKRTFVDYVRESKKEVESVFWRFFIQISIKEMRRMDMRILARDFHFGQNELSDQVMIDRIEKLMEKAPRSDHSMLYKQLRRIVGKVNAQQVLFLPTPTKTVMSARNTQKELELWQSHSLNKQLRERQVGLEERNSQLEKERQNMQSKAATAETKAATAETKLADAKAKLAETEAKAQSAALALAKLQAEYEKLKNPGSVTSSSPVVNQASLFPAAPAPSGPTQPNASAGPAPASPSSKSANPSPSNTSGGS